MWEFKTAALSDRSHHNATEVTYQQDKNLDEHTLDQAEILTGGIATATQLIIFMEIHAGKGYNWKATTEDLNTYYFPKL